MSNPYQSPPFDPKRFQDAPAYTPAPAHSPGMVNHVRIVAILNGVQGMLEIPMGLLTMSMGLLLPAMIRLDPNFKKQADGPPEEVFWLMAGLYLVMGTPIFLGGVLRIVAGFQNYRFKGRTLGFVSFIVGMCSVLGCYCAPTAIAVLVYGLIVYLHPTVAAAFQMRAAGKSADEVIGAFCSYQPAPPM